MPLHRSEAAQDRCILLPLYAGLTARQQAEIVTNLRSAIAEPSCAAAGPDGSDAAEPRRAAAPGRPSTMEGAGHAAE